MIQGETGMLIMKTTKLKIVLFLCFNFVLLANGRTINDGTAFSPVDSYKVGELNSYTRDIATGNSAQYLVNPVPKSAAGTEGQETKLQLKPLKPNHVLLKELFKTARNLQNDKIVQNEPVVQGDSNILLLDLNVKHSLDLLLDINPGLIKDRLKDFPPEKGSSVVPILSDLLCQACREKGDLECIKRHCLTENVPKNPDIDTKPIVPVLSDLLCQACKEKGDLECIEIHCLTAESAAKESQQNFNMLKPAVI